MENEHPAKKIKFLARTCQMSFQELADKVGLTLEALRDFLDERAVPPPSLLRRIAAALGARESFFGLSGDEKEPSKTRRPVTLAELAARHEALVRALIASGALRREEYERGLAEIRVRKAAPRPGSRPSAASGPSPASGRSSPPYPEPRSRKRQ